MIDVLALKNFICGTHSKDINYIPGKYLLGG